MSVLAFGSQQTVPGLVSLFGWIQSWIRLVPTATVNVAVPVSIL